MNPVAATWTARASAALFLVAVAAAAGCSSGAVGPSTPGPVTSRAQGGAARAALSSCASYGGARSCHYITVYASGAQAFHGTDVVPNPQTCTTVLAADASDDGGEVLLSAPVFMSDPTAAVNLYLDNYHGPGTYSLGGGSDARITFTIGGTQYTPVDSSSAVTAIASQDGSVSVTFSKLASDADQSRTISGTAQFTCKNT
jgi:hypothetical protein